MTTDMFIRFVRLWPGWIGLKMISLLSFAAAAMASCSVDHARYTQRVNPSVTAYFRPVDSGPEWPSGLALAVHYRSSGKIFWWLPWNGGSDGLQNVASTDDVTVAGWRAPNPDGGSRPFGNRQYLGFDAAYTLINHVPRRGDRPPAHMLFPDSAGAGDIAFVTKQFFDFAGC